jgi:hypothetical protein
MLMVLSLNVVVTLLVFLFAGLSFDSVIGLSFGWVIMAFILFLFWNYRGISIQVSDDKIVVTYGLFNKKTIMLTNVVSCKPTKASLSRYWGVGVRYGSDGSLAYSTSSGDAVEVTQRTGRAFVFSTKNPHSICKIINTLKPG